MSFFFPFLAVLAGSMILTQTGRAAADAAKKDGEGDYVVLLHGQSRTAFSMMRLEWGLRHLGYRVINQSYPSTRLSVEELSEGWLYQLLQAKVRDQNARVHFVTHSLGGIVVRQYLANHEVRNLGRVVMLAPPNQGSEIIDTLAGNALTRWLVGPKRLPLGTGTNSLPKRLGPVGFDLGVIAGDRSLNPLFSMMLDGPNDGKVSVANTQVAGMRDFLVVHTTHTWMMCRTRTLWQVVQFLGTGGFDHDKR